MQAYLENESFQTYVGELQAVYDGILENIGASEAIPEVSLGSDELPS